MIMDEYTEMADILFDIKDRITDFEYLRLLNLLKKIKDAETNIKIFNENTSILWNDFHNNQNVYMIRLIPRNE